MGKKGERLLRFLRSRKTKTPSGEVKKNLPNLQERRTARANDYFKSAGKSDLEMGSDARPDKIPLNYEELKISPEKVAPNDASTQIANAILSSTTSQILSRLTNEMKNGDISNLPKSERGKFNGKLINDIPVPTDTLPRMPQHPSTKRHPPNSKMDDSSDDDEPKVTVNTKCCKKEFPRKKARSVSEDRETVETFNDRRMKKITIQSETPCSSTTYFRNGLFRPYDFATSASEQPSSSFQTDNPSQTQICFEGDDARAQNIQINQEYPITIQRHQRQYHSQQPIYINDERDLGEFLPQTPKLAFTVTDKEGKGIELTIAVYGVALPHSNRNRSRNGDILHVNGRSNSVHQSTSRRFIPTEVRYENFATNATENRLDIQSRYPFIAMSPNPEAMSSISAANALSYHVEGRTYTKAVENSYHGDISGCHPSKESYKLTQDSITKLKSFFGQTLSNDPVKRTVFSSYEDVKKLNELAKILERVEECPWYWGNLTGQDSKKVLTEAEPGTFLLRLSSDPKYLFSLSVKTKRGPTSIRIVHEHGYFRFDSELNEAQRYARNAASSGDLSANRKGHPNYVHRITKKFTCVIHLVLYYTKHLLQNCPEEDNNGEEVTVINDEAVGLNREDRPGELFMCYWVTRSGRKEIPVLLSTPLPRKQFFPSLQSLCRSALSKEHELWDPANQDLVDRKDLPTSLRRFIKQYPYPI